MKKLSASGTFKMKMRGMTFTADQLIQKLTALSADKTLDHSVTDKLRHHAVDGTLPDGAADTGGNLLDGELTLPVFTQKIKHGFSLCGIITQFCHLNLRITLILVYTIILFLSRRIKRNIDTDTELC